MSPAARRNSIPVNIGPVTIGGTAPIVVQSMTNTDTADIAATVEQVAALARAGSELVRITVDRDELARAVPHIRDALDARGIDVPLIGDFHYIGHKLLTENPGLRRGSGQVPDQSRQRRLSRKARPPVLDDDRRRAAIRSAGSDRGQLGQPGPGTRGPHDGRERRSRRSRRPPPRSRRRRWSCPPSRAPGGPRNWGSPPTASSSPVRSATCRA